MATRKTPKLAHTKPLAPLRGKRSREEKVEAQLDLAFTFRTDNYKAATLRQHANPKIPTLSLDELDEEQWREITKRRIRAQEEFLVATPQREAMTKAQALREVEAGSEIGKVLVEWEKAQVRSLLKQKPIALALKAPLPAGKKKGTQR